MMLSTCPTAIRRREFHKPVFDASTRGPTPGKVEVSQLEDSTDVGSSSDAEMSQSSFVSPSCTDSELQVSAERVDVKHCRQSARFNSGKQASRSKGVASGRITGNSGGWCDHSTVLSTPAPLPVAHFQNKESMDYLAPASVSAPPGLDLPKRGHCEPCHLTPTLAIESFDASTREAQPAYPADSFRSPPGLPSPMRRRKAKRIVAQSMLATAPLRNTDVACLPASPNRRIRIAIMEKAKHDGVPLKVEPQIALDWPTASLNPAVPAKKKLPFDIASSMTQNVRKLKPGTPVKKRVDPWLLEDPSTASTVAPR
jgi:hypothetical protein